MFQTSKLVEHDLIPSIFQTMLDTRVAAKKTGFWAVLFRYWWNAACKAQNQCQQIWKPQTIPFKNQNTLRDRTRVWTILPWTSIADPKVVTIPAWFFNGTLQQRCMKFSLSLCLNWIQTVLLQHVIEKTQNQPNKQSLLSRLGFNVGSHIGNGSNALQVEAACLLN